MIDSLSFSPPNIPTLHPFVGVLASIPSRYWSATEDGVNFAWLVDLNGGYVYSDVRVSFSYVWPVRGGQ